MSKSFFRSSVQAAWGNLVVRSDGFVDFGEVIRDVLRLEQSDRSLNRVRSVVKSAEHILAVDDVVAQDDRDQAFDSDLLVEHFANRLCLGLAAVAGVGM